VEGSGPGAKQLLVSVATEGSWGKRARVKTGPLKVFGEMTKRTSRFRKLSHVGGNVPVLETRKCSSWLPFFILDVSGRPKLGGGKKGVREF